MTVQLSALRVGAEFDASKYVSGAAQKEAADRGMANSSREVATAISQTDTKLSQSGDAVARMSRQYVDGYANATRFNSALNSLSMQISRGNVGMTQAMAILDGIYKKHGIVGDSARFAARGQTELAEAIDRANAKLLQQQNMMPANQNLMGGDPRFRRTNLTYQLFDIGQSGFGGMNPAMIAAQQGPQIAQLYMGQGGIKTALADIAALAGNAARSLGPIAVAAGLGALAINDIRDSIEETTGKTATFGSTFSAVLSVIMDDIKSLISPITETFGPTFTYVFQQLGSAAVDIAELVVNAFRAAFYDIKTLWESFPDIMEAAITGAVNSLIDGLNVMTQKTAAGLDLLIGKINEITGSDYQLIGDRLKLPNVPNAAADRLRQRMDTREEEIARIMTSTPLRDYYRDVTRRAGEVIDRNNPQILNSDGRMVAVPIPGAKPNLLGEAPEKLDKAAEKLLKAAEKLNEDMIFERDQLFRSTNEQQVASRLRSAGLPIDFNSPEAKYMAETQAIQESRQQAKDLATNFGSAFSNELISGSHNIGKAFLKGFESAVTNAATKMWEKLFDNLGNAFADWVTGGSKGGGLGGLGGGASSIASSVMSSTSVAANDNSPVSGAGASLAWNFWKSKGLADHQVAGILGNIKAESGFNPLAVGDSGNAFGLYQHNDRRNSLFSAIGGRGNLGDELAQHKFAYSELMGPENRSWQALMASKDVRGATAAFAGFERPSGFSWANPEGAHNFSGRLAGAEQALSKFGGTATQATQSLGGFGNGLSQVGNALSGAGGGAGGIFGLTSLGMGIFNKSGQFASAMLGGGLGLFADGTESAPGGIAMVGERGRELVRLPRGSQVIPNHRTESMVAANRNTRGGRGSDGPQTLQVVIQGASGDAHIRTLVEQGVNSALADQNVAMRRGTFGTVNKAYSDDKG